MPEGVRLKVTHRHDCHRCAQMKWSASLAAVLIVESRSRFNFIIIARIEPQILAAVKKTGQEVPGKCLKCKTSVFDEVISAALPYPAQ
jgi:hypothetical protein